MFRGSTIWRAALLGAGFGLALVVVVAVYSVMNRADTAKTASTDAVVVVLSSPNSDASSVAQLIAIVRDGRVTDVSPDAWVTVPGISPGRLGDIYAFQGASGIVSAIATQTGTPDPGWIDIDPTVWGPLVDKAGGVTVTVPAAVNAFDGTRLVSVPQGPQRLQSRELGALLAGMAYLPEDQRAVIREGLDRTLLALIVASKITPEPSKTNLSAASVQEWSTRLAAAGLLTTSPVVP